MSDFESLDPAALEPPAPPGWEVSISAEIDALARKAQALETAWRDRYPEACWKHPGFTDAYRKISSAPQVDRVLGALRERAPGRSFSPRLPAVLGEAVRQAKDHLGQGLVPDIEPVLRLLAWGQEILEHPELRPYQADFLSRFPSSLPLSTETRAELSPAPPFPSGTVFGQYRVEELIGSGGFAHVYRVMHEGLKERRAAKYFFDLASDGPVSQRLRQAFFDEAQTQVRLKHPNIVGVHDLVTASGRPVLIMEWVEGRNLLGWIEERKAQSGHLSPLETIDVGIAVAQALSFAHGQGIVHRDIKPENILLGPAGSIKVSDFGLAKPLNECGQRRTTRLGSLIGSPHYMAPEQFTEDLYGPGIDQYSLGACLYHMAYGEPPFIGTDIWAVLDKHRFADPVPVGMLLEQFPASLDRAILRCLRKDPKERFTSVDELIEVLEACKRELAPQAGDLSAPRAGKKRALEARPLRLILALALAGLGAAVFTTLLRAPAPGTAGRGQETQASVLSGIAGPREEIPAPEAPTRKTSPVPPQAPLPPPEVPQAVARSVENPSPLLPIPGAAKAPAAPRFREKLLRGALSPASKSLTRALQDLFERHRSRLLARSYDEVALELDLLARDPRWLDDADAASELRAARRLLDSARGAVDLRREALERSAGPVSVRLADGRRVQGNPEHASAGSIAIRSGSGILSTIPLSSIAPEEFIPGASLPAVELAYRGLSLEAARTLPQIFELEGSDEGLLMWIPILVRLARVELHEKASRAARVAAQALDRPEPAAPSTDALLTATEFAAASGHLSEVAENVLALFESAGADLEAAKQEKEALDLLLARQFSRLLSSYPTSAAAPVAGDFIRIRFERTLKEGAEELLLGSGYWDNGWSLSPTHPDFRVRQTLLVADPRDQTLALQDPEGPRSIAMGGVDTRVREGVCCRFNLEPLGPMRSQARFEFLLRGEKSESECFRFEPERVQLVRRVLEPGAPDQVLAQAPLPPASAQDPFRSILIVPTGDGLHLFADGQAVLSISPHEARLPQQLAITVYHAKLTIRELKAPKPRPGDGSAK